MYERIHYRKSRGYKYQLMEKYVYETGLKIPETVRTKNNWIRMTMTKGRLTIKKGYLWDGPSGPAIDTKNFMRGSLVHDVLYQLIRENLLDKKNRKEADRILRDICIEDGMSKFRANYVYHAVRIFGAKSAKPKKRLV